MSRMRIYGAQFGLGLLLALTLWTYVSFTTNPNAARQIIAPVDLVGLKEGIIVVNAETGLPEAFTATTTLSIIGPSQDIQNLSPNDFHATAQLEDGKPGVNRVPIVADGPRFARVRSKSPAELTLRLARELVTTVPITVTSDGLPPFSFSVGHLIQGAREASVRGPEELVRRVVGAIGQVSLQGQTGDISTTVPLKAVEAGGTPVEGVTLTPERVSVQVPIAAQVEEQQVSVVPDLRGQPAQGYAVGSIDWNPKTIRVFTSGAITGTIHTEPIDLNGLTRPITRSVGLERLSNVITRPAVVQVQVRVGIVPIAVPSQLPLLVSVSPSGLSPGLTATAEPTALQLTLDGPFDRLNHLKSGDIVATVDLTGLGPGTFTLPVRITHPDGLQVVAPADPRVKVTIVATPTPSPESTPTTATTATP